MKYFLLMLLLVCQSALAQISTDVTHVEDYDHEPGNQKLPVSIDSHGDIEFHLTGGTANYSLSPTVAADFKRTTINYVSPIPFEVFAIDEAFPYQPWIEFRTARREIGLGINLKGPFKLGISPYKGSYESTVVLRRRTRSWRSTSLPAKLGDLSQWTVNDSGDYQTYGGIMVAGSFSVMDQITLGADIALQNNFIVGLKRLSVDDIELTLSEEKISSRRLKASASVIKGSLAAIKGRLFQSRFCLQLSNPLHHELYQKALQGRIMELQRTLNVTAQQISWYGTDKRFYFGIPSVLGEERNWTDFHFDGRDEGLYIQQKRTKGLLTKFREHKNYVYHSGRGIIILWTSKMKKVSLKELRKKFINRALALHLRGFERETFLAPANLGNLITEIGIAFTKNELLSMDRHSIMDSENFMTESCGLKRKLRRAACLRHVRQLFGKIRKSLKSPWPKLRRDFGVLLSQDPALIYALIKSRKWEKKAYVKFLSQTYQSLEGSSDIIIE